MFDPSLPEIDLLSSYNALAVCFANFAIAALFVGIFRKKRGDGG